MTNTCQSCGVELESLDIAASQKFFGREIKTFFCCDCIAEHLGITREELTERINAFRSQGCTLFG